MVKVEFCNEGSNSRTRQEQTWIHFGDFLDKCEGVCTHLDNKELLSLCTLHSCFSEACFSEGETTCSVGDVLVFFSGSNCVPPVGFPHQPKVSFLKGEARLCTSSTCEIRLRIPTQYVDYAAFEEAMILSFNGNDGFGAV